MNKKLYDYKLDENLEIFLLIKSANKKITRTNKPFISFTFQDTSGQMGGNLWDSSEEDEQTFLPGEVVHIKGKREEYKGAPQLKINSIRLAVEGEPNNPELYVERAPLNKNEMIEQLNSAIFEITNPTMNRVVRFILNKYHKSFFEFPAASKNHHAFYGGLAFHTVSMLSIAQSLVQLYPNINKSLLYSGLILHDIGKVTELSGPTATEYTLEGKLLGHITMISEEISKACNELNIDESEEEVLLLKHVVLSHHGKLEFGSPMVPKLREAEILHHIDNIDARINMMNDTLDKTEKGEFTPRIWGLENRSFYNPFNEDISTDTKDE